MNSDKRETRQVRIAVIGFGWMGRVHSMAYSRLPQHFPGLAPLPRLVAVADDVSGRAKSAASQFGFERAVTDWRPLVDDPGIDAVSITTPNFAHREIGEAFARSGKHIWIEKPVGVDIADTTAIAEAIHHAGVVSRVGFNYRNVPAVREAKTLIEAGAIGTPTHGSFRLLGDYAADPAGAFTWRYEIARAGHGVVGDLAAHGVDLIRFLLGEIDEVIADSAIFVPRRQRSADATTGHTRVESGEFVEVENEDWTSALLRLRSGARIALESSRVAVGHQNDYGFRIHGTAGSVSWDFRRMGELEVSRGGQAQDQAMSTVFIGPGSGSFAAFQPGSALSMSYDDLKVIEARDFLAAIGGDPDADGADVDDAIAMAGALDAITRSVASGRWEAAAGDAK